MSKTVDVDQDACNAKAEELFAILRKGPPSEAALAVTFLVVRLCEETNNDGSDIDFIMETAKKLYRERNAH